MIGVVILVKFLPQDLVKYIAMTVNIMCMHITDTFSMTLRTAPQCEIP